MAELDLEMCLVALPRELRKRVHLLLKENINLRRRIERFPGQKARAIDKAVEAATENTNFDAPVVLKFKVNGVVPEHIRALVRDLVGLGLKVNQVKKAITQMATAAGLTVEGNMSERTGGRVVKEGGIMAQMQVVEELQSADGATLSSDGTTHRHIPQESRHLQLNTGSSNTTHFLGGFFNTHPIDPRTFPLKLCKKLFRIVENWVREETAFLLALAEETRSVVEAAGGETAWRQLSPEDLAAKNVSIQQAEAYQAMPQHERQLADLFDLNAFKGGATPGLQAPVLLMNKDNTATAAAGPSVAQARAVEQSRGGGPKHAELSGTLFRHKDDKKGQQDSMRWFFLASPLAKLLTFPDTSNTRYGSYGDAASVLLLSIVVDRKDSGEATNLERNVRAGLEDEPTLAEHCAIHPYMRAVRSSTHLNHLSLGPLHDHVLAHIQRLIDDPDLLLGPDASYETAVLDGQPWGHPDAIAGVQRLLPRLPYLRRALNTWRQFTAEFAPGGTIARLTDRERELAAMPATNDRNEGALGLYRYLARTMPNISVDQYNARIMWHQNGTATYAAKLTPEVHKFDGSGSQRQQRLTEALRKRVHREEVAEKKTARQVKLSKLKTWTTGLTVPVVDEQLDWQREWVDKGAKDGKQIAIKKLLPNKRSMLRELRAAVRRYKMDETLQVRARKSLEAVGIVWLGSVYEDLEVEPEEEGADEDAVGEGRGQSDGIDARRTQSGDKV
ncbi:hypothetical protein BD311DRAFT_789384 [Dichomitus squalens]|uniref:Uncharacterized protein n=1 Tax=Dichomitus squalens TaxID=114155 RepID=A0A4Q9MLP8_9APHY|nr:hypothetical protein BD311DRAFT_789384 [Dichomitus squalens]